MYDLAAVKTELDTVAFFFQLGSDDPALIQLVFKIIDGFPVAVYTYCSKQ